MELYFNKMLRLTFWRCLLKLIQVSPSLGKIGVRWERTWQDQDLQTVKSLVDVVDWDSSLNKWACITGFKGVLYPFKNKAENASPDKLHETEASALKEVSDLISCNDEASVKDKNGTEPNILTEGINTINGMTTVAYAEKLDAPYLVDLDTSETSALKEVSELSSCNEVKGQNDAEPNIMLNSVNVTCAEKSEAPDSVVHDNTSTDNNSIMLQEMTSNDGGDHTFMAEAIYPEDSMENSSEITVETKKSCAIVHQKSNVGCADTKSDAEVSEPKDLDSNNTTSQQEIDVGNLSSLLGIKGINNTKVDCPLGDVQENESVSNDFVSTNDNEEESHEITTLDHNKCSNLSEEDNSQLKTPNESNTKCEQHKTDRHNVGRSRRGRVRQNGRNYGKRGKRRFQCEKVTRELDIDKDEERILKFRATCYRVGDKHSFSSMEAACEFGGTLQDKFGWTVDLTQFDLNVIVNIENKYGYICLAITHASRHQRNITHFSNTTLRSTLCYNLVRLAEPMTGELVVDPLCGGGSIPIEGALGFPNTFHICGDYNEKAMIRTRNNIEYNINDKKMKVGAVRWNVRNLPLKDQSVDILVTDLPFGKRSGSKPDNLWLYSTVLFSLAKVIKRGTGRACLLTYDKTALIRALRWHSAYWREIRQFGVNQGGLFSTVFLLLRKATAVPENSIDENNPKETTHVTSNKNNSSLSEKISIEQISGVGSNNVPDEEKIIPEENSEKDNSSSVEAPSIPKLTLEKDNNSFEEGKGIPNQPSEKDNSPEEGKRIPDQTSEKDNFSEEGKGILEISLKDNFQEIEENSTSDK